MVFPSRYPDSQPPARFQDSLGLFYWEKLDQFADKTLFVDYVSGRQWTGKEIKQKASRVADWLINVLQAKRGDCCYFFAPNNDYLQIAAVGCILAGCSVCVSAPGEPKTELLYMLEQVNPKIFFLSNKHSEILGDLKRHNQLKPSIKICLLDEDVNLKPKTLIEHEIPFVRLHEDLLTFQPQGHSHEPLRPAHGDSPAYILFTSGSTGRPKPVARTNRNSLYVAHSFDTTNGELWDLEAKDMVMAGHLALDHGTGTFSIKMCLAKGFKMIIMDGYEFERMVKAIDRYAITDIMLGSALLHQFLLKPESELANHNIKSIRNLIAIGSPMASHKTALEFMDKHPQVSIRQAFGMTECGFISLVSQGECRHDSSSVGYVLPNLTLKLINRGYDSDRKNSANSSPEVAGDEVTKANQRGELYVRGPTVSPGYLGAQYERESKRVFLADGFYTSNDVASISAEGKLFIHGRFSDVLCLYDGWKVLPQEIEALLAEHEGIREAGVIGIPHPELATCHAPRAYVVPSEQWAKLLTVEHVNAFAREHLSEYKQLIGGVVILNEPLPRGSLQKLDRKQLYQRYKTEAQSEAA